MTLPLRPTLGLAAAAVLCYFSCAEFPPAYFSYFCWTAFAGLCVALVLAVAACLLPDGTLPLPPLFGVGPAEWLLGAVGFVLLFLAVGWAVVFNLQDDRAWAQAALPRVALAGWIVLLLALAARRVHWAVPLGVGLTTGLLLRLLALVAAPDPLIDVYSILRDAPDHVLRGTNPYAADIESPYETERAKKIGLTLPREDRPAAYPPLPIVAALPFRALHLDPRLANVTADLVAALALFAVARYRGWPRLGVLAAIVYLHLPRVPRIIESAWYEPLLAALFGVGLCLVERPGRRWAGYLLLALGLTGKQFGLPLLVPMAWARRRDWRYLAVALAIAVLLILPWFLWSPSDFIDIVVLKHLARPTQSDSLTITSAVMQAFEWQTPPPALRLVMWAAAGVLIVLVCWRGPQRGAEVALGMGTVLLVFCVFHTQGYLNYFYLCEYLWLLGYVAGQSPAADSPAAAAPPT
jgi:hypothetical protein